MRIIAALFRAYPGRTAKMLAALLLAGLAEGFGLATLLPLLSAAAGGISGGEVAARPAGRLVTGILAFCGLDARPGILLAIVVAAILSKCLLVLIAKREVGYAVADVATELRLKLIRALLDARWEYFARQPLGSLANAVASEAMRASQAYLSAANTVALALQALVYLGVALLVSWPITLVALGLALLLLAGLHNLVCKSRRAGARQTELLQRLLRHLTDSLQSIKPLKAMAREERADKLLVRETGRLNRALRKQVFTKAAVKALQEPLVMLVMVAGLFVALRFLRMAMAEVMVLLFLLARTLQQLGKVQQNYQKMVIFESAYWSLLEKVAAAAAAAEVVGYGRKPVFLREIVFERVSFAYAGTPVLEQVELLFPAGSFTVLIGPSGAGKTTVLDLVAGLCQPVAGRILVDGEPLHDFELRAWRKLVGYVPQEPLLLNDSIRLNITLGDPAIDDDEVRAALAAAGALEFVERLPDGLEAGVGERGEMLSGGQRQRLAIARALVGRPRLLLLDEVTSALDRASEAAICETLKGLRGKLTIIAVSHRSALVGIADRVYRCAGGRVVAVEEGEVGN